MRFEIKKGGPLRAKPLQPLFLCAIDDSLWLSEAEAVDHVLSKHFATFYQTEKTPTDPPKGTYTFVAQCGMSGASFSARRTITITKTSRASFNAERSSRMPFPRPSNCRVAIVRKKRSWISGLSSRSSRPNLWANIPERRALAGRELVEKHFREVHLPFKHQSRWRSTLLSGRKSPTSSARLAAFVRAAWETQKNLDSGGDDPQLTIRRPRPPIFQG